MPLSDRTLRTRLSARVTAGGACTALLLVLVPALALAGCSSGSSSKSTTSSTKKKGAPPKVLAVKTSVLHVGSVDVESAGPPNVQIDPATGRQVLGTAQAYIDNALFAPLKTGKLGRAYGSLFDARVKATATGVNERALTDLDAGQATGLLTKATPVVLSALAGPLGDLEYIATDFDIAVHANRGTERLTITHHVELTFAKVGKVWLVTAYRVETVTKTSKGTTTTTTVKGGKAP